MSSCVHCVDVLMLFIQCVDVLMLLFDVNEDRMYAIPANRILLRVVYSVNDTFPYLVFDPMVHRPTSLKYYRTVEHVLDLSLFRQLHKLDFFKKSSDMIFSYVVKATKMEKRLRE